MKILITTEFYLPLRCGVTSAVLAEKKALEDTGDEVRILTIGSNEKSFYDDALSAWYVKETMRQPYKDSHASMNLRDICVKEAIEWHPDIVHSQSEFFSFRFARHIASRLSVPLVHTCHTDFVSYTVHFTSHYRIWNWAASKVVPFLIRKADRVICSTDKIYSLISSYGIKQPIDRILVGVDLFLFSRRLTGDERKALRTSLGFDDEDTVFVSVSRLSREKNVDEVLSLFSKVKGRVKLLIVGDGEERKALEKRVRTEGLADKVVFTGLIDSSVIWKYYQAGDIYIGASLSETQCLSYIEAMASSLPLLVRYDSILSDYLVPGVNGFSYNTENEFLALAGTLMSSIDRRREIGKAAVLTSLSFSLPIFADKLHESFRRAGKGE